MLQKAFVSAVDASDCSYCLGFICPAMISCRALLGKYSYSLRKLGWKGGFVAFAQAFSVEFFDSLW